MEATLAAQCRFFGGMVEAMSLTRKGMGLRGVRALHRVLYYERAMLPLRGQPRDSGRCYLLYVPFAAATNRAGRG